MSVDRRRPACPACPARPARRLRRLRGAARASLCRRPRAIHPLVALAAILGVALLAVTLLMTPAHAHSGGTDAEGCHTNSETGHRHCHEECVAGPAAIAGMVAGALFLGGIGGFVFALRSLRRRNEPDAP